MRSKLLGIVLGVSVLFALPVMAAPRTVPLEDSSTDPLRWVRTGGPIGGLGYDVRVNAGDSNRMYVTDAFSGVFVSNDCGRTWTPSNEGITARSGEAGDSIPVFCLTLDQNRPGTIWIGTQAVRGVYRSQDDGGHWAEKVQGITESEGITFRGFAVDPRDSDIVYGAAEISSFAWAGEERRGGEFDMVKGVVYKTMDGGEHWAAVWRGDNLARYIWIDPRDTDVVYVSTGIFDREAANSSPASELPGGVGVIKTIDGGRTWRSVVTGMGNRYVGSLFMHPRNPDVLLAGTGNVHYHDGAGVYLTTDGGENWRRTLKDDIITAVEFSVSDPRIAYAGSTGSIYRSADGGLTWRKMTAVEGWGPPGVRAGFPIDLQVDPGNPNRLFANNYGGGNFLSTDAGRTWTSASHGYTGAQTRALALDPSHAGRAFVAARSGVFRTNDGGSSWEGAGRPPANLTEFNAFAVDPRGGSRMLAGSSAGGVLFASFDGSASWKVVARVGPNLGWRAVFFASCNPSVVYAGVGGFESAGAFSNQLPGAGVFVSENGGQTWRKPTGSFSTANIAALAVDRANAAHVFAATTDNGVLESEDGGRTWKRLLGGLPASLPSLSIAVDPGDSRVLLAGFEGASVFRSADGGTSWKKASGGLDPEAAVSSVVFSPVDSSVAYAADRRTGVYRSADGGETWSLVSDGLLCRAVGALAFSGDGMHLYAATEGGGVYRLDLSGAPPARYRVPPPASLARPRPSRTAVPKSTSFWVSGSVSPHHATAGTLACEKYSGGRWRAVSAYTRTWISSVSGAFRVSYRLPAGKYRFRAAHGSSASTSCHLRSVSAYSLAVTVK